MLWSLPWWLSGKELCLPAQETEVRSLDRADPMCHGTAKPEGHNYRACVLGPGTVAETSTRETKPRTRRAGELGLARPGPRGVSTPSSEPGTKW